ncbi:MAG: T9SS type A sorting domain-containing protein [Saprospiraceae bacterium]
MKSFTLIFTALLIPFLSISQSEEIENQLPQNLWEKFNPYAFQTDVWINDSVYCYSYDDNTGETNPSSRTYNKEFSPSGALLVSETQVFRNGEWENEKRIENTLDELGVLEAQAELIWNSTTMGWYYDERSLFEYSTNGQFTNVTVQSFDLNNQSWVNKSRNVYSYSNFNRPDEFLGQKWENGTWLNDFRVTYTYNSNGLENSSNYQKWNPDLNDWENVNRTFTTFDGNGLPYQTKRETWGSGSMTYRNSSRSTFTYNAQNLLENTLNESWNPSDSVWTITGDQTQYYDGDANLIELNSRNWNGVSMVNYFRFIRNYDVNGNLIYQKSELFVNGNWRLLEYCDYYYSLRTFINTEELLKDICKFPNPVQPGQVLQCEQLDLLQPDRWVLTNLNGQIIHKERYAGQIEMGQNLQPGMYLLTVIKGGKISAQNKLMVQP